MGDKAASAKQCPGGPRRLGPRPPAIFSLACLHPGCGGRRRAAAHFRWIIAIVGAACGPASAASVAEGALSTEQMKKLSLEELMQIEVPTVYGASKHEQKTTEAPSSVSIVTQDDIKKYGHRTLSDILDSVAGFYVTYDAFAVVNFTLFSRELVKDLEFSGSVYNLFDQPYTHPVSADFTYTGPVSGNAIALGAIEQDGRTFRIKLTYRF